MKYFSNFNTLLFTRESSAYNRSQADVLRDDRENRIGVKGLTALYLKYLQEAGPADAELSGSTVPPPSA